MATLPLAARFATACVCDSSSAAAAGPLKSAEKKAVQSSRQGALSSSFIQGTGSLQARCSTRLPAQRRTSGIAIQATATTEAAPAAEKVERFRLNNLGPQKGSRRKEKRKGRGIAAGQGASCGFGMRGQKSRSGSGVRPGFEGGQKPLYRLLPKLRGIAGGMPSGQTKYVAINLISIPQSDGVDINLEYLKEQGLINASGRERDLRLKVLGDGEVTAKFSITAAAFSTSAREKLEAAGCTLIDEPGKKKFLPKLAEKRAAKLEEFLAKKNAAN